MKSMISTNWQIASCMKTEARNSLLICFLIIAVCTKSNPAMAQDTGRGYFNSISVGVNAGTTGVGFDVATPIGNYLALRAGISMMPGFNFTVKDVDVDIPYHDNEYPSTMNVKGTFKRTSGEVSLYFYFGKNSPLFLCGGFSFGGDRLIGIEANTDNAELIQMVRDGEKVGIEVGNYSIPINENGDISGGLKVASFRPYIGAGTGRINPKGRIGFTVEGGIQLHKSPKVYTNYGTLGNLGDEADNDFNKIMDIFCVYPVVKLRLCGRIF